MSLKWVDNVAQLLEKGAEAPGFNLFPIYSGPFSYLNEGHTAGAQPVLANAKITKVCVGSEEYAVVILCIIDEEEGAPRWSICCGDAQVSGKYANEGKTLAEILRKQGVVGQKVCNTLELSPWVGKIKEQGNCGFHRMQERHANGGPWRLCSHAAAVLHSEEKPVLESMAEELQRWLSGEDNAIDDVMPSAFPEEEAILDAAFVQNVLLAGERGSGKTYFARKVAELFGAVYIELQAHASVEAYELRAHDRAWNGKVYTVLGKLAEAVYWIQQGKRVVLCIDEFLNMNPMHTTVINSALTLTSNDTYLIETGRIIDLGDGIGRVETVEVPADMLWVVATTNIGARYNIDKMPPSVRARFQIILMNTNAERTASILEKNLEKYEMPAKLAPMFRTFIERCNQAVVENNLDEEATTRLACNVIRSVHKKAVRDKRQYSSLAAWLPSIKKQVMLEIAQVVNFDTGLLDPEQKDIYTHMVDACFKTRRA